MTRDSGRPSLWGGLSSLCKVSSLEMSVAWALPAKDLELSFLQEDSGGRETWLEVEMGTCLGGRGGKKGGRRWRWDTSE